MYLLIYRGPTVRLVAFSGTGSLLDWHRGDVWGAYGRVGGSKTPSRRRVLIFYRVPNVRFTSIRLSYLAGIKSQANDIVLRVEEVRQTGGSVALVLPMLTLTRIKRRFYECLHLRDVDHNQSEAISRRELLLLPVRFPRRPVRYLLKLAVIKRPKPALERTAWHGAWVFPCEGATSG